MRVATIAETFKAKKRQVPTSDKLYKITCHLLALDPFTLLALENNDGHAIVNHTMTQHFLPNYLASRYLMKSLSKYFPTKMLPTQFDNPRQLAQIKHFLGLPCRICMRVLKKPTPKSKKR